MFTYEQVEDIVEVLSELDTTTKIYLGCDSIRKGNYAKYATVCIIHKNGNNGCIIYSNISYEKRSRFEKR